MNKAKLEKEKKNAKLLFQYFAHYGFSHGFWTFVDAFCSRLKIQKVYENADKKRYEYCKNYLRKNYSDIIKKYQNTNLAESLDTISEESNIWVFWWQGEKELPYPVDLCLQSIKANRGKHEVIVITKDNFRDYVTLPSFIIEKFESGKMPIALFSDVLRFELLNHYGGIWLDSTFYMTGKLSSEIYSHCFYSIANDHGRKWCVTKDLWSICLMAMGKGNPLAAYLCDMNKIYWKKEDINIAYLLSDCFIAIAYEDIEAFKNMIDLVPTNNTGVFDLLEPIRNEICSQQEFKNLMGETYIHKLTYKEKYIAEVDGKKTYFGWHISYQ